MPDAIDRSAPERTAPGDALDRETAARVLRRAAALSETTGSDDDVIDPVVLVDAAAEVGIAPSAVRRSLAIEELGAVTAPSRLGRVAGANVVVAERTIDAAPEVVLERLAAWLRSRHFLRQERSRPGEMTWAKRRGLAASALRSTRTITGEGRLGDVQLLRAQAVGVDVDRSLVRVSIDRTHDRRLRLATGSVFGVSGAVAVGTAVVTGPVGLTGLALAAAGAGVTRSGTRQAAALRHELQRLLDAVAEGRTPRSRWSKGARISAS